MGDRSGRTMARQSDTSNERTGKPLNAVELARIAAEVLGSSPLPALVLEIPSQRIVASSLRAAQLLDPSAGVVLGHTLEDFTSDSPPAGVDLFAGGRLNGFETIRVLRRRNGTDVTARMWVRNFNHQPPSRYVLVVIVAADPTLSSDHPTDWQDTPAVVGTIDSRLLIERISSDAELMFGRSVPDLLGTSLLGLVAEQDVSACLNALAETSDSQRGVTLNLEIYAPAELVLESLHCEVLLLPLQPTPSCAFVFLPTQVDISGIAVSDDLSAILARLGRGAQIAELARGVFRGITERDLPGLNKLTTRELEIVTSLLEGNRPPGIARNLFLTQSTVRNHLASVFAKIGVNSQQELIDLFRTAQVVPDPS
jgi:DNA-binding CsgD family transcriptional regulator